MESKTRKDKLVLLGQYLDLETNELKSDNPGKALCEKIVQKKRLDRRIDRCVRCPNLNIKSFTKSIPGWGNLNADIFLIGESPCVHSMTSNFPFAWKSGNILDIILKLSGLTRYDVFISNSMHCHPETKRTPTDNELRRCRRYLHEEMQIVSPLLVVTLGNAAKTTIKSMIAKLLLPNILHKKHPASFLYNSAGLSDYILGFSLELDKVSKQ